MTVIIFTLFMAYRKYVLIALLSVTLCGITGYAMPKDISKKVMDETSLDEQIVMFCLEYCQGNQRKGYLKSVILDKLDTKHYRVIGRAALQNRQVMRNPLEFVLYDHTVIINASGILTPENCELRVEDVYIQNDINNIFNTLLKENAGVIGRTETIPDCKRFIE